jgi:hypothetical protein
MDEVPAMDTEWKGKAEKEKEKAEGNHTRRLMLESKRQALRETQGQWIRARDDYSREREALRRDRVRKHNGDHGAAWSIYATSLKEEVGN